MVIFMKHKTVHRLLMAIAFLVCIALPLFAEDAAPDSATLQRRLDYVWVMVASILVFIMQAGFMSLESGMARAKNSINVATKNLADFLIASIGYWFIGFGIMFGTSFSGLFGTSDFFVEIGSNPWRAAFFVFQTMFAGTAATIDSGAVAERTKFSGYLIMSFFISILIYPVFGHWAWGSFLHGGEKGWLEALGFLDFAGSTVVHSIGAWVALAGVLVIGPRIGKYNADGSSRKIHPHSLRLVYLGTFLLFFGWFGFNAGSTLRATEDIAGIILNTTLAACFSGIACTLMSWFFNENKLPEAEMLANGVVGGLVGITAGCAFVETTGAMAIGIVSGIIVYGGIRILDEVFHVDDVVGAISVHGFAGAWGTIAVGIFITPPKLALTGLTRLEQTGIQALGAGAAFVWAFVSALIILLVLKKFNLLRVPPDDEEKGLNVSQHGAHSSILELTHSMKKITETEHYDESLKVWAERGTEAGDLADYFNSMVDTLRLRHRKETDTLTDEKNHIETTFGRYVSPKIRDEILRGKYVDLGGEKICASVLFCDIRNFTTISESLPPNEVVDLLNMFFNEMVKPIIDNDGVLDKFIGDSIMAVFGPPLNYEDHADRALDTALIMIQKLAGFNEMQKLKKDRELAVGIGINTGEVIAGNIGSSERMDYTVIGDTVNIAARIEGLTKKIGSPILFSEFTHDALGDRSIFSHREVGLVRVKGRRMPFRVFQPVFN